MFPKLLLVVFALTFSVGITAEDRSLNKLTPENRFKIDEFLRAHKTHEKIRVTDLSSEVELEKKGNVLRVGIRNVILYDIDLQNNSVKDRTGKKVGEVDLKNLMDLFDIVAGAQPSDQMHEWLLEHQAFVHRAIDQQKFYGKFGG